MQGSQHRDSLLQPPWQMPQDSGSTRWASHLQPGSQLTDVQGPKWRSQRCYRATWGHVFQQCSFTTPLLPQYNLGNKILTRGIFWHWERSILTCFSQGKSLFSVALSPLYLCIFTVVSHGIHRCAVYMDTQAQINNISQNTQKRAARWLQKEKRNSSLKVLTLPALHSWK